VEVIYARPLDEIDGEVRALCTKLAKMHHIATKLKDNVKELTELGKYLGPLGQQADFGLRDLSFSGSHLFSQVFVLPNEPFETLRSELGNHLIQSIPVNVENETVMYGIARVEDQEAIETVVRDGGGRVLQIPEKDLPLREFLEAADGNIRSFEEELAKLQTEIEAKTRKASEAKYVTLIEGWIPESIAEDTVSTIKNKVDHVYIDTMKPQDAEEPPTKFRNFPAFRPFQVVVKLFGIPKYKEWDPTPMMSYSFPFFFGLMLNDVAYSAILLLFTNRGLKMFVDDPETEGFKLFQRMLYISGAAGLVFGLLTGSYFGNLLQLFNIESLALAGWIESLLGNPVRFIVLSIFIGLIHVNIAHLLTLIKGAKAGSKGTVVSKVGLFSLEIGAIPWIVNKMLRVDIPILPEQAYPILLYVAGAGLVLIIASYLKMNGPLLAGGCGFSHLLPGLFLQFNGYYTT